MVTVDVVGDRAIFDVEASHKLWAIRSRVEVPLSHIKRVYVDPNPAMGWFDGFKVAGADLPHVFRAGTFWLHGEWAFFDVRHPENTIVVELENEHYAKLIVEVADPAATVQMLERSLPR
jgi:hypothetical protein